LFSFFLNSVLLQDEPSCQDEERRVAPFIARLTLIRNGTALGTARRPPSGSSCRAPHSKGWHCEHLSLESLQVSYKSGLTGTEKL